jgi:hypothetical protein
VPADRLELLSDHIEERFRTFAKIHGRAAGGYAYYVDLAKTKAKLPVRLYCDGRHTRINKIQFEDVAHLGRRMVRTIVREICGDLLHVKIYRLDLCVDIGMPLLDLALYCRLARVHNCRIERSGPTFTFYLQYSKNRKILFYDKIAQLRSKHPSAADRFRKGENLTRVEVQLRASALPYRRFADIEKYTDLDLLSGVSFRSWARKKESLKPIEALAADGLLAKINEQGLQLTSKMYPSSMWAYLQGKFFIPAVPKDFPDLNELLKKSTRDWMENKVRFPRTRKRSSE